MTETKRGPAASKGKEVPRTGLLNNYTQTEQTPGEATPRQGEMKVLVCLHVSFKRLA